jgi:hypothetical protein
VVTATLRFAGPAALLLAAALVGWWPLRGGDAAWGHDTLMHLHRIAAVHRSWLEGNFHPRWFDGFFFGYGYPVLHFYAPLTYYLGALVRLLGAEVPMAFGLIVLLARIAGAFGAFLLGRLLFGSGWVTGVAFVLLPYQLTEIYVRAALAELLALNLLPWALWCVERLIAAAKGGARGGNGLARGAALAGLFVAALVLAHQTTALVTTATVAAFAATRLAGAPRSALGWLAAAVALGVALSAFFWLGIVADGHHVSLEAQPPGFPPFTGHLFPTSQVLQSTIAASYAWPEVVQIPRVELLLVAAGAVAAIATRRRALIFPLTAWLIAVFLMTEPARPLWDAFPAAQLMQYPFRLRMVTTLAVALLVGGLPWRPVAVGAVALVAWASLSSLTPVLTRPEPSSFDAGAFARYELVPFFPETGTTVPAQFKPRSVRLSQEELKQSRARPEVAEPELLAGVTVVGRGPTELRLRTLLTESPSFRLKVHQFWFPGWRAWVDGAEVPTAPDGERGLVALDVPSGGHDVVLRWQDDPRWTAAAVVSGAALVVAAWLAGGRLAGALALALLISATLLGGRVAAATPAPARGADVPFPGGLTLVGWAASPRGDLLDVDLWWVARRDISADHVVELRVDDETYRRAPNWGSTPTSTWSRGEVVRDRHTLALPFAAGGDVPFAVGVVGVEAPRPLGTIALPRERTVTFTDFFQPETRFANGLTLVSRRFPEVDALPRGGTLPVDLTWQVHGDVPSDVAVSVVLSDHAGTKHAVRDTYPPHDLRFTMAWPRRTLHGHRLELPIDRNLPMGVYDLSVELYDYVTGQRVQLADNPSTRLPLRRYKAAAPPAPAELAARFADGVALAGHAVRAAPGGLEVELRWAATARPSRDYTVYLHLYDAGGALIAQSDGPPVEGRYPTSFWDAGELIAETRRLPMPPGAASLKIGMYEPTGGARLSTADGRDGLEMALPYTAGITRPGGAP